MDKIELIKQINTKRKAIKNEWYYINTYFNNRHILIKGFGTWLQVFTIDGIDHSNGMDMSVKEFNKHLNNSL